VKIAINGFGRVGRALFRILDARPDIELVAINDLFEPKTLMYLLRYDTVMGRFEGPVDLEDGTVVTGNTRARMLAEPDPANLPWEELGVELVVEASGVFRTAEQLEKHLNAGAQRVVLTVPAKDQIDYTVVLGVNEDGLKPEHRMISNASCTTNCLAPMAKVLHEAFGIEEGVINTVHAYTNDQRLADVPHTDWRRSRAAAENIIPTSTGAARAVGVVLPELKGKLDGIASRVPVADGSVVDLVVELATDVTVEDVHQAVREASQTDRLKNILQYSDRPLVSSDIIGNPYSSIYDSTFTAVVGGRHLKTLNWYDNEWGYSCRIRDLIELISQFDA
jgi:glyceraldehyde 3-phosphate dehydrogenase